MSYLSNTLIEQMRGMIRTMDDMIKVLDGKEPLIIEEELSLEKLTELISFFNKIGIDLLFTNDAGNCLCITTADELIKIYNDKKGATCKNL